jgi:hypothetical protein
MTSGLWAGSRGGIAANVVEGTCHRWLTHLHHHFVGSGLFPMNERLVVTAVMLVV